MNRILLIVVVIMIPFAVFMKDDTVTSVMYGDTLEKTKLEVSISDSLENKNEVKSYQVLISNNANKSDPYYVDLEEYVIGVVAGEMPASFNLEALKAQAVASRTYALYKLSNYKNYVLSTTISDQVYLSEQAMRAKWGNDYNYYYNRIKQAVEETKDEVLKYGDDLAVTYYFAISNGYTDNAKTVFNEDKAYLVSVDSSWDRGFSSYSSSFSMLKSNFCTRLNISCDNISITNLVRGSNHYVSEVTINGVRFTGVEVFNKLNLKSHDFDFKIKDNYVEIVTLGFGHGVGMSQYGAQGMSSSGYNYKDILTHYYQNTKLAKI